MVGSVEQDKNPEIYVAWLAKITQLTTAGVLTEVGRVVMEPKEFSPP